jgi:hypothetical protein
VGKLPRVNPGLCFLGRFGPQIGTSKLKPPNRLTDAKTHTWDTLSMQSVRSLLLDSRDFFRLELNRKANFDGPIAWELEEVRRIFGITTH